MVNDDDNFFDAIIIGTGLAESILAAALSKAKYKVAHIDPNPYYGGDDASLSQDELLKWGEQVSAGLHPTFSSYSGTSQVLPYCRQYSICLKPAIIPCVGPFIASLVASGVAKYSEFNLLNSINIYSGDGTVKSVPNSKDAVFKSKDISLVEKRRLMRFLLFAASEFEEKPEIQGKEDQAFAEFLKTTFQLGDDTIIVIVYSLAHSVSTQDPTLPSLLRLRGYLRSIGRYGPSPFLFGHYGGIGDISQGFCRAAAVNGGVYVLGRRIISTTFHSSPNSADEAHIEMQLDDFPEVLKSKLLISCKRDILAVGSISRHMIPTPTSVSQSSLISKVARCIAILDKPLKFHNRNSAIPADGVNALDPSISSIDNAILVIPPGSLSGGSNSNPATVFVNGEGSLATPKGRWILYITLPLTSLANAATAENVLQPYLEVVLGFTQSPGEALTEPLSTSFFFENYQPEDVGDIEASEGLPRHIIMPSMRYPMFPDLPDNAALCAEAVFTRAVRSLRSMQGDIVAEEEEIDFWPPIEVEEVNSDDES